MNVLIKYCWCSDSIWGGQYNCRVIVSIDRVQDDKSYYDPHEPDWLNLVEEHTLSPEQQKDWHCWCTHRLKPEVLEWLKANIKDRTPDCDDHKQGWAIGTDRYNANDRISFSLFFERPSEALKFIKRWSSHKKPVDYLNYFQDIRRKLDTKTGRLHRVAR